MRYQLSYVFYFLLSVNCLFASTQERIEELHKRAYKLFDTAPEEALIIGQQTEQQAHEEGLDVLEANSIFIQAWVYKLQNQQGKRFLLYLKALEVLKPIKSTPEASSLYITILRNTGIILQDHYAYTEAIKCFDEALELSLKDSNSEIIARLLQNKAMTNMDEGNPKAALENIISALNHARLINNQILELDLLNEKGLVEIELDDFEAARESFKKLISKTETDDNFFKYVGLAWSNIAYSYFQENKLHEAISAYKRSQETWSLHDGFYYEEFKVKSNLAEVYTLLGKVKEAETTAVLAAQLYDKILLLPEHYRIFDLLSSIYFEKGEYLKSHQNAVKYREENEKFLDFQNQMLKVKDQYKMEILAAGFFLEHNASKENNAYFIILTIISSLFSILLVAGIIRQYYLKKEIKQAIIDIHNKV